MGNRDCMLYSFLPWDEGEMTPDIMCLSPFRTRALHVATTKNTEFGISLIAAQLRAFAGMFLTFFK